MKTITITAAEERIILNALRSRCNDAKSKSKYLGTTPRLKEKLINIAIDATALRNKIDNS